MGEPDAAAASVRPWCCLRAGGTYARTAGGLLVRREERLDRELAGGHLDRRAEGRDRADERELAPGCAAAAARRSRAPAASRARGARVGAASSSSSASSAASPVSAIWRSRRSSRCPRHSPRLAIRGATPSGCRLTRRTLTGGSSSLGRHAGGEQRHGAVGAEHLPGAVDHDRRVGVVAVEDQVDRAAHGRHLGVLQVVLLEDRGVAGGQQQLVAVAQRHVELLGELQRPCRRWDASGRSRRSSGAAPTRPPRAPGRAGSAGAAGASRAAAARRPGLPRRSPWRRH